MGALHDCVFGGFVGSFFGGDFQNDWVDLLSFVDQLFDEFLARVLCDQDDCDVGVF